MKTIVISLCMLLTTAMQAEVITFQMSAFGIKFGTMTVSREQENDSVEVYRLKASGYLKVLWMERRDETKNEVRFCRGKLISSTYSQVENGTLKKWANVHTAADDHLTIDAHTGKKTIKARPLASVIMLYFHNPANLSKLFNEADGNFITVQSIAANTYETKNSNGKTIYRYLSNKIHEVEFHIPAATVYAKRLPL